MLENNYRLWSDDEMVTHGGSGKGTFLSCIPSITYFASNNESRDKGCVIVCPGGGYEIKTMGYEGEDVALFLNSHGIDAYVLDYRIKPDFHPAPLTDALRAIELARSMAEEKNYSAEKIGIMGFSAGGHLAASAGTMWTSEDNRPDALGLCYPLITMGKYGHSSSKANLIGDRMTEGLADDLSCENRVNKQTPPAFIWHTANDETLPAENVLLFAEAMSAKSIPYELHIYPDGRHGLGLAKDYPGVSSWPGLFVDWLKRLGF